MQYIKHLGLSSMLYALMVINVQAAPQDEGSWSSIVDWPLIAIHSVLTPQGKILNFGTDENGAQGAHFIYDVWDPESGTGSSSHNTSPNTLGVDSFCSAAVLMPETGNVLMAGGDSRPSTGSEKKGVNDAPIFNTQTNGLSRASDMGSARWYPTSTVLTSGDILLTGGRDGEGRAVMVPEVYSPSTNVWRSLLGVSSGGDYPRQWLAPNGLVFGYASDKKMYYLNTSGNGSRQELGDLDIDGDPYSGTAVMYEPGKILAIGGEGDTNNDTVIIDINGNNPVVRSVSKPSESGRIWSDSIVLPNGNVMVVGGSKEANKAEGVADNPEIWDPSTEEWTKMKSTNTSRLYHSTAILLKDGRILVAGGGAPGPVVNTNAEIFSPPYLYNSSGDLASRPTISSAPDEAPYDENISVSHPSGNNISRVTLIKTGAVTHSFNMEQRFIELDFTDTSTGVRVKLPASANIAPPGYYLMHLVDNQGVPSEAHIIRISSTAQTDDGAFPVAIADTVSATANVSKTISVLSNDTGNGLTISDYNRSSQNGGTITKSGNNLIYKSTAIFNGADVFWYVIKDSSGRTNFAKVTVSVSGGTGNPYPVGNPDTASASGSRITIDVLANDVGSGLELETPNAWSTNGGNVSLSSNQIRYTPAPGFNGFDKLWYTFKDALGRKSWGEVTITVSGNTSSPAPKAYGDYGYATGDTLTIDVLANDAGSGLVLNTPNEWSWKGGRVSVTNNKLSYKQKPGFNGQDKVWYSMKDSQNRQAWSVVIIDVIGTVTFNPVPVGNADNHSASSGVNSTINVLANDVGNGLVLNPLSSAYSWKGGTLSIVNNQIRYKSKTGFVGQDKLWYTFKDVEGRVSWSAVAINVTQ